LQALLYFLAGTHRLQVFPMLSYQQFLAKHPVKYKGLTTQQKRKRYTDYQRSINGNTGTNRNNNTRRTRASRNRSGRSRPSVVSQSSAAGYLNLYAKPFDADTVGLPVFPSPPSSKQTCWSRGSFTVGTGGVGFIIGTPVTGSDVTSLCFSSSAYAGSVLASTGTGVTTTGLTNVPISSASLSAETSGSRARVALAALRVRYTGTEQNRGGIIYPYVHPLHQDITGKDISWLASQEDYVAAPVSRDWITIVWTPVHRTECDYYHLGAPPSHANAETAAGGYSMGFIVSSANGNTFEYQFVEHVEYTGPTTMWLSKTDNGVSVNLTDTIDKLQDVKLAVRADGAPRRDLRPPSLTQMLTGAVGAGLIRLAVNRIARDEL